MANPREDEQRLRKYGNYKEQLKISALDAIRNMFDQSTAQMYDEDPQCAGRFDKLREQQAFAVDLQLIPKSRRPDLEADYWVFSPPIEWGEVCPKRSSIDDKVTLLIHTQWNSKFPNTNLMLGFAKAVIHYFGQFQLEPRTQLAKGEELLDLLTNFAGDENERRFFLL